MLVFSLIIIFFSALLCMVFYDFNTLRTEQERLVKHVRQDIIAYETKFTDSLKNNSQCCHSANKELRNRIEQLQKRIRVLEANQREDNGRTDIKTSDTELKD